jgi:hypothetical protein
MCAPITQVEMRASALRQGPSIAAGRTIASAPSPPPAMHRTSPHQAGHIGVQVNQDMQQRKRFLGAIRKQK